MLERDPVTGQPLASQPTLSRFENSLTAEDLLAMELAFLRAVLERQRERRQSARIIYIDLDPTRGQQQLSLFNGFFDTWCYLPLVATVTFDNEAEQYVVGAKLRKGTAHATEGVEELLDDLLPYLRKLFPKAKLRIRLDSGFQQNAAEPSSRA